MSLPLSVVIVSFNACEDLGRCLESLQTAQGCEFETIVFDNGSSDGTAELVRTRFPRVRLIENAENLGLTRGVNQACRQATGDHICLLDADTVVEPGVLGLLRNFLMDHPEAGIVTGRMLNPDGTIQETARNFPSLANAVLGRQTMLSRWFPNNTWTRAYLRREDLENTQPFEVGWVAAACMMFRRELYQAIGGLDEDYFVYWVDADWCMRVHLRGHQVWCVPAARILHVEQNRMGKKKSERGIRSFHEGAFLFYRKHYVKSVWNPMLLLAKMGLGVRCELMVAANRLLR